MVFMWLLVWYAINSMLAKKQTNVPTDGQPIEELETIHINRDDSDQLAFSWRYSMFRGITNNPFIYEAYTVTL